mmetsp:Transcript_29257/g.74423  ORF Transcript_29257/g.74423 Transcript_29257/m.74423 type:complete len:249 (-) Transcript_29257:414-1160(-)
MRSLVASFVSTATTSSSLLLSGTSTRKWAASASCVPVVGSTLLDSPFPVFISVPLMYRLREACAIFRSWICIVGTPASNAMSSTMESFTRQDEDSETVRRLALLMRSVVLRKCTARLFASLYSWRLMGPARCWALDMSSRLYFSKNSMDCTWLSLLESRRWSMSFACATDSLGVRWFVAALTNSCSSATSSPLASRAANASRGLLAAAPSRWTNSAKVTGRNSASCAVGVVDGAGVGGRGERLEEHAR